MEPSIHPAREVPEHALHAFYREIYPDRALAETWRWLYRTSWDEHPLPLVMTDGSRVIAHAGGIPFVAERTGTRMRAQWFVDFALLPEYRRRGLGARLTERWTESADLAVTFCNEDSWRVFERLGWLTSPEPVLHTLWLRAGDHPRLKDMPGPARAVAGAAVSAIMGVVRAGAAPPAPRALDTHGLEALSAASAATEDGQTEIVTAARDADYLQWRIEQSPARSKYRLFEDDDAMMLVSGGDGDRLDVLWMAPATAGRSIRGSLAALARWAAAAGYSSLRYLPASPAIAASLTALLPIVSRPRFAYWCADESTRAQLAGSGWRWQLIDSDFEWI